MLRTRLYLGLLPLLLLLIATSGYAVLVSRQLARTLQHDLNAHYQALIAYQKMQDAAQAMANEATASVRIDPTGARKEFERYRAEFRNVLMAQSISSAGTLRTPYIEEIDTAFTNFVRLCEAHVAAGGAGTMEMLRDVQTAGFTTRRTIDNLRQRDFLDVQASTLRVERLATRMTQIIASGVIAAFLLSLFLAWRLAGSLLRPIKAVTASAVALGEGNLDREVPVTSRDELGQLARAFNTMAGKLRAYHDATAARVMRTQRTMEATLTSAPDPVFVVNRDGTHEVRNPAAEELILSPDLAGGFPPELAEPLAEVFATGNHYLPTDYRKVVTFKLAREDRHYLPRILAIGDKLTEFKGAAIILQDVTKFRLLDDAKTNLVGTVSHELKTPLTSLRMALYLLLEQNVGELAPKQRELIETARDDSERLLRILDTLLDLAHFESGVAALSKREVKVVNLLQDTAREIQPVIRAAEQTLEVQAGPGLSVIHADTDRLRHVFMNLLTNASKYSPEGSTITLYATPGPSGFVRFGVRDQGRGIPTESVSRIFDRFYRVPGTQKKGAGLGLAIAREIVVAHGGSIACSSEPDKGSDFYFLLPL